jgi:RNA polymerase sigma-70 factor (ECF subfamily)
VPGLLLYDLFRKTKQTDEQKRSDPMTDLTDPIQFDRAYRDLAPGARRAALRVLGDQAAAEDVVQEVFMDLWQRPRSYDPRRGPLGSYVSMVARARAIDRWRASRALERAVDRSTREAGPPQSHESAAEGVLRRERSRQVLRALDRIPRAQREALLLTGTGLAHHEIAAATRTPLGTVKGRVRLGLDKARAALAT